MARLILVTPEGSQTVELRPVNSLGRHPSNSVQLLDKIVSKEHCIVELRGNVFVLRDLGSLNGTYINGERVRGEQALRHGDEISMGSTRGRFDDGSGLAGISAPQPQWQPPPQPPRGPALPPLPPPRPAMASSPTYGGPSQAPVSHGAPSQAMPSRGSVPPASGYGPPSNGAGFGANQGGPGYAAPNTTPRGAPGSMAPHSATPQSPNALPGGGSLPPLRPRMPSHPGAPPSRPQPPQAPPGGTAAMPAMQQPMGGFGRPPMRPRPPTLIGTRIDLLDSARAIERQIAARTKGFLPFDQVSSDPRQLGVDYERLRITWELSRDIALERDLDVLLEKVLKAIFSFVRAERGIILLREPDGSLQPRAAHRRDGTEAPIELSTTILNHVVNERASVLTHDASSDFASAKGKSMILNRISSAMVVPLMHEKDVLGALWLDSPALAQFQEKDLEVVTTVANQAAMFVENNLLAKKVEQEIISRERFSRLLSPNVAEQVLSGKLEVKKGGVRMPDCTVFNSDIRGFTAMSEGASAEMMVELLNEYFELMVETIFKYEGTLDKFMGDGIMAFWGAPVAHQDDAVRSVQSALEQMEVLRKFNEARAVHGIPPLSIGMGLHTGHLVAGYVGSSKALSYTVIGDTVNTSARLCGIAGSGQVIVSEATLSRLGEKFDYEELQPAALKGKEKPLRIFNVLRERPSAHAARPPHG